MGGSGKDEKESWSGARLTVLLAPPWFTGNTRALPTAAADQCQDRIRTGAIPGWG